MIPESLLAALDNSQKVVLPKGTIIQDFDKYIRQIPFVTSGSVKVMTEDANGREIILYHLKAGDSCVASILGALTQSSSKIRAITLEDTELVMLKPELMRKLLLENPVWLDFFVQLYQTRFEELLQAITNVGFKQLDQRVEEWLKERSKLLQTRVFLITHKEIAEEFGTSREVISRVLKKLEQEGILKLGRGRLIMK
ncbi:MAG TPA: Crp/Fnr family transcriptional regulator [Luteibaculaceae bacterium]|nr:Crp/Fnr family transcriptional regulator [Luteibaculaceae bacterium]